MNDIKFKGKNNHTVNQYERWRPQGHILKSLALKVKSLALKLQVFETCPVLGWKTAVFYELLKFFKSPEKNFEDLFFFLFFGERLTHSSFTPFT